MSKKMKRTTLREVMKKRVWLKPGYLKWFIVVLLLTGLLLATYSTAFAIPGGHPGFQDPPIFVPWR